MSSELQDLQQMISAVNLAQSRGAYKLEESESLAKSMRVVTQYMKQLQATLQQQEQMRQTAQVAHSQQS